MVLVNQSYTTYSLQLYKIRVFCSACADLPRALQNTGALNIPAYSSKQVTPGYDTKRHLTREKTFAHAQFLEWLLPLLVQVLVAGPLHHPPLLTSQNMTSATKSWVDQ